MELPGLNSGRDFVCVCEVQISRIFVSYEHKEKSISTSLCFILNEMPTIILPYIHGEILQGYFRGSPTSYFPCLVWVRATGRKKNTEAATNRIDLSQRPQSVAILKQSSLEKEAEVGVRPKMPGHGAKRQSSSNQQRQVFRLANTYWVAA